MAYPSVWIPNRITLISRGRHEEAHADEDCFPGMLLLKNPDGNLTPHNLFGGTGPLLVAKEDALRGGTTLTVLPAGSDGTPYCVAAKGDVLLMLLQNAQNVGAQVPLMSGGDGTLVAVPTGPLYQITTASTVVTNTSSLTTFSNGTYTVGANVLLAPGDVIRIAGTVNVLGQNATNTHRVEVFIGSTVLVDFTALSLAAGAVLEFAIELRLTVTGASGKFVGTGTYRYTTGADVVTSGVVPAVVTPAAWTENTITITSTSIDTTATQAITVKTTASAANVANQIQLSQFQVALDLETQFIALCTSQEAINNTNGTGTSPFNHAAFIRVIVN